MTEDVSWGPTGRAVYERTYSRVKPNGERETWPETVIRVVTGNLSLVYGPPETWSKSVWHEFDSFVEYMTNFAILPAGRHVWASGVKGRQYLFNCHVSGWGEKLSRHFEFTFLRLMEGGGVGANYSSTYLSKFGAPRRSLRVHIVCDKAHPDYEELRPFLSDEYDSDWEGTFEVEDSREGWAAALVDLIDTYMTDNEVKHENRVYDVSRVRGRGARLKTFGGSASGPAPFARMMLEIARVMNGSAEVAIKDNEHYGSLGLPLNDDLQLTPLEAMEIDHAIAECVVAGGNRRSARMSIVRWDDPYIFDFIGCKRDTGKHWTTNISVEIDDTFIEALTRAYSGELVKNLSVEWRALKVHEAVAEGMLTNGEPGYWNRSLSQVGEVGQVVCTNPCGEIALEPWENCNLGHINLDYFAPKTQTGRIDWAALGEAHRLMTRFLIRATYGDVNDEAQRAKLAANRRIGVGHLGVQGFWAKRGYRYSEVPDDGLADGELEMLYHTVREEARRYAFELRIPEPIKVTTVAPTGSIAKLPGVTEGIHPIYARFFERRVRYSMRDDAQREQVEAFIKEGFEVETDLYDESGSTMCVVFPTKEKLVAEVEAMGYPSDIVESADELTAEQMLAFQEMYQQHWADNAVSFTVNVPEGRYTVDELGETLARFLMSLKGVTVMVDGSRPQSPYTRITEAEYEAAWAKRIEDSTDEECASGACPVR